MSRFRQVDITRAIKAMTAAGLAIDRVEIAIDGTVTVFAADDGQARGRPNSMDALLAGAIDKTQPEDDWRSRQPLYANMRKLPDGSWVPK
ncbi:hypothetical protein BH10PSE12_BH10PSE12_18770 [soil metagenome]